MTIIVYSSKTGSTKKYAEILSSRTGLACYSVKEKFPDDMIIFLGWLRGPRIVGIDRVDMNRVLAVAAVSLDDNPEFGWKKVKDINHVSVPFYHMRGWIDRSKIGIVSKIMFCFLCAMYKLRGLNDHTKPLFNAMMEGGSFFDESGLDPICEFVASRK